MRSTKIAATATFCALLMGACVGFTSVSYGKATTSTAVSFPKSGCGSFTTRTPENDGVLKTLDSTHRAQYAGLSQTADVVRSPWANWKPKKKTGWKVALLGGPQTNSGQVESQGTIETLAKANKSISSFKVYDTDTQTDVSEQVSQFETVLASKPNVIVLEALAPASMTSLVAKAGKAGIPVVTYNGDINSRYAVNDSFNTYLAAAEDFSLMARAVGGKGNVLFVHAIPGTTADLGTAAALTNVLKNCPNMHLTGQVNGYYESSAAESATLQFLASNPAPISMVAQTDGMSPGIIQAFESAGRPVPPVLEAGLTAGGLAYWQAHTASYKDAGYAYNGNQLGTQVYDVISRLLDGDGPKVNYLVQDGTLVTPANVNTVAHSSAPLSDADFVQFPGFATGSWLDDYFNKQ